MFGFDVAAVRGIEDASNAATAGTIARSRIKKLMIGFKGP